MGQDIYGSRVEKLVKSMKAKGVDGFVFTASVNMYYFTGFEEIQRPRFFSLVIPTQGEPFVVAPTMYLHQLLETTWIKDVVSWADGESPYKKMGAALKERNLEHARLAVDDTMWGIFLLNMQKALPQIEFVIGKEHMDELRRVKSKEEIELQKHIGNITDTVMGRAIAAVKAGVKERDVAKVIENGFRELGATPPGPIAIVGSGEFGAQPHYRATDKIINNGDSVVLDFGAIWKYYRSDMTRTVFVGNPPDEYVKIYNIVKKAQAEAIKAIRPGVTCEYIDSVARNIISEEGYGAYFIHRTGHGIGLDTHEEPNIVKGNALVLQPGMTFSIEPGIYMPGLYGVRIEDCVYVTETGAERFTNYPHDLIVIS